MLPWRPFACAASSSSCALWAFETSYLPLAKYTVIVFTLVRLSKLETRPDVAVYRCPLAAVTPAWIAPAISRASFENVTLFAMNLSGVSYLPSMLTCNPGINSSALAVFRRMTPLVSRTSVPSLTVTSIRPIPSVWTHTVLLSTRAVTTPLMRSSAAAEVAHDHTMAAVSSEPSAMRNRMRLERISHLLLDDRGVDTPRHPSVSVRQEQHHPSGERHTRGME